MARALVIEGGGMKAAFANGVLTAFEDAGFRPWSALYGTSAGGALAAWYAAGQARFAEGTWKYARDPRILSYRRAVTGRGPVLDHGTLLDVVYGDEHPLDVSAVMGARFPVIVTAAEVQTGRCLYRDLRDGDVLDWLKATGRLPLGSGPPVTIDGHDYLDGGVLDPIPVRRAVEDGADHVTLILNKPVGPVRADPRIMAELAARRFPALRDGIMRHHEIKTEAVAYAQDPPEGVRVDIIVPPIQTSVHRMSRDLAAIQDAIRLGHVSGTAYLAGEPSMPVRP